MARKARKGGSEGEDSRAGRHEGQSEMSPRQCKGERGEAARGHGGTGARGHGGVKRGPEAQRLGGPEESALAGRLTSWHVDKGRMTTQRGAGDRMIGWGFILVMARG